MRTLFGITLLVLLAGVSVASARPQLHTESIGWIEKSDIYCEQTSDHICVVKTSLAYTWAEPATDEEKYKVRSGTELIILDEQNDRAEVAIVIPGDWDQREGHEGELRPYAPCHLKKTGKTPQVVSLSCR
jgi:hypothetical protein